MRSELGEQMVPPPVMLQSRPLESPSVGRTALSSLGICLGGESAVRRPERPAPPPQMNRSRRQKVRPAPRAARPERVDPSPGGPGSLSSLASATQSLQDQSVAEAISRQRLPTVSVCTVTQNRAHLLPLLEQCILAQTYPRELIQWIIVDDSDPGYPKFEPASSALLQIRLICLDKKIPLGQKRNVSHQFCEGEIIVYMDDDEYYPPRRIEHAVESLEVSGKEVAGTTNLPILFIPEREIWMAGPFGENHATANTFAFRRSLLAKTKYEDAATHAEEKAFLRNYSIPMVQLDPRQTLVCFGHQSNTFEKRRLMMNGQNPKMRPLPSTSLDEWIDRSTLEQHIAAHHQTRQQVQPSLNAVSAGGAAPSAQLRVTAITAPAAVAAPVVAAAISTAPPIRTYAVAQGRVKLDIIIPSRSQAKQQAFLQQCIHSVESQTVARDVAIRVIICCDPGYKKANIPSTALPLIITESPRPSQAAALNAGIAMVESDLVAFLEDDDQWCSQFLEISLQAQKLLETSHGRNGIISSTQLQVNELGAALGVNDYAIPSGWLMDCKTLAAIGGFDGSYRFHLDNDWLGRAALQRIPRFHLVESGASHSTESGHHLRVGLEKLLRNSADTCQLVRHHNPEPLIRRLVHSDSGMGRIHTDKIAGLISHQENTRLLMTYGRIPW